jgi:hypothetical protein
VETQRLRRKDLKGPDEFQHATQRVLSYLVAHEREVAFAIVAVALVIAVVLGIHGYRGWRDRQASDAFRTAFRAYGADDVAVAGPGFAEVTESWPGSRWSQLALVYQGELATRRGEREEATRVFSILLERTRDPVFRQIAEYNLGVIKQASGDSRSVEHFRRAAEITGPLQVAAVIAATAGRSGADEFEGIDIADLEPVLPPELREFIARGEQDQ